MERPLDHFAIDLNAAAMAASRMQCREEGSALPNPSPWPWTAFGS